MITDCDINSDYIKRADIIWGLAESVLQVKNLKNQKKQNYKTDTASINIKTT